ncbi:hypothetical protein [Streptomyces daliensis]|uniref:DUF8094 domain-containing protein n=1 Tax=Streptomyces daliensis TaxID=299421 RepID=A0A8T4IUS1_9ACTN|nr:hypothetical protein [Streptomyces daliensis]
MRNSARGLAGVACAGSLVLVMAGCGGDSGGGSESGSGSGSASDGGRGAAPAGVVTKAKAAKLVDRYEKVNSQANEKSDPKLLSTVEGGAVFEQSKATYKMQKNWSRKEITEYREPFVYVDREYYIPRKGTADWFAVVAHSKNPGKRKGEFPGILIMEKQSDGDWKLVAGSYSETKWMPKFAKDKDGFAVPVSDPAKKTGPMAPEKLSDGLVELYTSQGSTASTGFADSETVTSVRAIPKEQNRLLSPHGEAKFSRGEPTHEEVHALKTADGGLLSVFSTEIREHDRGTSAIASVNPSDSMQVYLGSASAMPSFFVDWLHQTSAYIPPKTGKVRLLGTEYDMTDAKPGAGMNGDMPGTNT